MSFGEIDESVVFLDMAGADGDYPTGGRLRLRLHGSRRHVIGSMAAEGHNLRPGLGPSVWFPFVRMRTRLDEEDRERGAYEVESGPRVGFARRLADAVDRLTEHLQPGYTAAWVAGYARVTAVIPAHGKTILAATPLYVEHVD